MESDLILKSCALKILKETILWVVMVWWPEDVALYRKVEPLP